MLPVLSLFVMSACSPRSNTESVNAAQTNQLSVTSSHTAVLPAKKIDHIVVVVEENHSQQEIIGNRNAPYINSLAKQGATFTNYHAVEHPSQPNYLDLFSGANQGVTNDAVPHRSFATENLGSELLKKKLTFGGYSEDLPSIGYTGSQQLKKGGTYARKHNPWVNFSNLPVRVNMRFTDFPKEYSKLPAVSFIIPNMKHDMHDGTIREADNWLKNNLDSYVQWAKTHNSLLIVTWDEDDRSQNNKIPTFFVGPMVRMGTYTENLNHFNLLHTLEDLYGLPHAGKSKAAASISGVWK